MPRLTIEGVGDFEVPEGKRLVLALADNAGIDQLHACGGNARCTTCRVEFLEGEPLKMTVAEKDTLHARELSGVRLRSLKKGSTAKPAGFVLKNGSSTRQLQPISSISTLAKAGESR